jgi:hypothetical protein
MENKLTFHKRKSIASDKNAHGGAPRPIWFLLIDGKQYNSKTYIVERRFNNGQKGYSMIFCGVGLGYLYNGKYSFETLYEAKKALVKYFNENNQ